MSNQDKAFFTPFKSECSIMPKENNKIPECTTKVCTVSPNAQNISDNISDKGKKEHIFCVVRKLVLREINLFLSIFELVHLK